MNRREIKQTARFRAGLILESAMNDWYPDDLIDRVGQATVDEIQEEITAIARKLIDGKPR